MVYICRALAHNDISDAQAGTRPRPKPSFPTPRLRVVCRDLNHAGANAFFNYNNPATSLSQSVNAVLSTLYQPTRTNDHIPPTRSVTLILRSMDGVAYTTGSDLDDDHKEIHLSLDYVSKAPSARAQDEIQGVLVHEMVHCWQWNGLGTAPVGLTEGIADFVRLEAGLSPPHWKVERGGGWDAGYQHTAFFLKWLENQCGEGSVKKINQALESEKYVEGAFWVQLFDKNIEELWKEYSETLPKHHITDKNRLKGLLSGECCW